MYETDIRHIVHRGTEEESRNRLRAFRTGWTEALNGRHFNANTLANVTWTNLGWRMGQLLGSQDQQTQEQLFTILADLQTAEQRPATDTADE